MDSFVDLRPGHPSGFELLVKLLRVPRGDLVDPDSLGHVLFVVREIGIKEITLSLGDYPRFLATVSPYQDPMRAC